MTPPEDLVEALARDELALVIGAGVSFGATGSPCMLWTPLLRDGIDEATRLGRLADPRAENPRAELSTGDMDDLLSVGNKITSLLGGREGGDFRAWMRRNFTNLQIRSPGTLDAV